MKRIVWLTGLVVAVVALAGPADAQGRRGGGGSGQRPGAGRPEGATQRPPDSYGRGRPDGAGRPEGAPQRPPDSYGRRGGKPEGAPQRPPDSYRGRPGSGQRPGSAQ